MFLVLATTTLISSCNGQPPLELSAVKYEKKVDGIDLCISSIQVFKLSAEEKLALSRTSKENAAQVNCLLALKCGHVIPHPEMCQEYNR